MRYATALHRIFHTLAAGRYLFPQTVAGQQMHPIRHLYMGALAGRLATERAGQRINVLEVGSWIGSSVITWGEALDRANADWRLCCCDAWRDTYGEKEIEIIPGEALEMRDTLGLMSVALQTGVARELFEYNIQTGGFKDKVSIFEGLSHETMPMLRDGFFDMVFLDAAHSYTEVKRDILEGSRLVREGGYLCGDDLELSWTAVDQAYGTPHLEADCIVDPVAGLPYHPGVSKATLEAFGEIETFSGFWVLQKTADGFKPVTLSGQKLVPPSHLTGPFGKVAADFAQQYNTHHGL